MDINSTVVNRRIRIKVPKDYHQEPVISRLVSEYGLIVNIRAALLAANAVGDGWFDLDLQGTETQIQNGFTYLQELGLEIWDENQVSNW